MGPAVTALLILLAVGGTGPAAAVSNPPGATGDSELVRSVQPLTAADGPVAWSVQGDRIAYSRANADGYLQLWIARPDGQGDRCLTCDPLEFRDRHAADPTWHPSGKYIVFVLEKPHKEGGRPVPFARVPGVNRGDDLWAISIDGKTFLKITNRGDTGGHVLSPRFSHEGDRLAWSERTQSGGGAWGTWVLRVGHFSVSRGLPRLRQVKSHHVGDLPAFFEPYGFTADDHSLIFAANLDPGQLESALDLYTLHLDDGALNRLTAAAREMDRFASLCPDGRRIVWSSSQGLGGSRLSSVERGAGSGEPPLDLWTMASDGGDALRLTHFNDPLSADYAGRVRVTSPTWNPAGDQLLVLVTPLGVPDDGNLYTIEFSRTCGE